MFSKTFVQEIAIKTNLPEADVDLVLRQFYTAIKESLLSGEDVQLPGLGTLRVQHLASLKEVDPSSGRVSLYPPKDSLEFIPES
ncbi:MAG: HU family DNA-binding protein [Bacteroidetes bacterium]|nr:HU family DNA-binding protein [Bacteroidota bacterium]